MSIKHHFHGCQKRRWYVLRLLSSAISSTWLYLFLCVCVSVVTADHCDQLMEVKVLCECVCIGLGLVEKVRERGGVLCMHNENCTENNAECLLIYQAVL